MDEGEFARLALQGGPSQWVQKVEECIEAAKAAGDIFDDQFGRVWEVGWSIN